MNCKYITTFASECQDVSVHSRIRFAKHLTSPPRTAGDSAHSRSHLLKTRRLLRAAFCATHPPLADATSIDYPLVANSQYSRLQGDTSCHARVYSDVPRVPPRPLRGCRGQSPTHSARASPQRARQFDTVETLIIHVITSVSFERMRSIRSKLDASSAAGCHCPKWRTCTRDLVPPIRHTLPPAHAMPRTPRTLYRVSQLHYTLWYNYSRVPPPIWTMVAAAWVDDKSPLTSRVLYH